MAGRPEKYAQDIILEASVPLFWKNGMDKLSINTLTTELNIPKPSLYRHFKNEDGLKQAVLQAYEQKYLKAFSTCFGGDADYPTIRSAYIAMLISGVESYPRGCLMFQTREAANDIGPGTKSSSDAIYERLSHLIRGWLARAEARGEITVKTSLSTAVFMFLQTASLVRNAMREGLDQDAVTEAASLHLNSLVSTMK